MTHKKNVTLRFTFKKMLEEFDIFSIFIWKYANFFVPLHLNSEN